MLLEVTWGQISIHHSGLRIDFEWFQASWRLLQLTVSYNLSQAEGILKVFGLPQIGEAAKENSVFFSLPQYLLSLEEMAVFACSNCFLNLSTLPGHTGSPSISSLNAVSPQKIICLQSLPPFWKTEGRVGAGRGTNPFKKQYWLFNYNSEDEFLSRLTGWKRSECLEENASSALS